MKAVIPAAGQGTRLYPQTYTKPKPLVCIAGKPLLGHILDNLVESRIDDVVIIVGVMRDMVVDYVEENYSDLFTVDFVDQERTEGLGHSVYQARPVVDDEPICILLGDMLFDNNYETFLQAHERIEDCAGTVGVKQVDDPTSYGIVTLDEEGQIVDLVEKPTDPDSDLAISGVYCIEDSAALFEELAYLIESDIRGAGDEYQLTDALSRMVDSGLTLRTFEVDDWYDCGRPETLLKANQLLLRRNGTDDAEPESSVVIPPVEIADDADVIHSVVGPDVSIDAGAEIVDSRIKRSIIGEESSVRDTNIADSIVGDHFEVSSVSNSLNIGDWSEVEL
jgi:glucose-1-phosphate thymidylyltransferase